ncbi:MAG: hypothetical protein ACK4QP_10210 [Pseudorhizobium sp.]
MLEATVGSAGVSHIDEASRKALALDGSYKRWLAELADPNANDNDLQDFAKDPEFKKRVR